MCDVSTGHGKIVQIVCGAPNARTGLKAPLANIGAVLPGNFNIKKAKLRGAESQGMLCAQTELQIFDEDEGEDKGLMELATDAPVGMDLREYLSLDDVIIEIGLTPNRADCLGLIGIARDIAVLNNLSASEPAMEPVPVTIDETFPIVVEAVEKCPRYLGRVIRGIDLTRPSPLFLTERLRRAGLRSIDPVVDVTNYVMLELGQPLHAFDFSTLQAGIVVRDAKHGEKITLLDGSEVTLNEGTLLIADHQKPLALAGIMGGENSGVSKATTDIFLESAFFSPEPMAGRARSYGLHTDASHRYERGVDWQLQRKAMERASQLLLDIVGGEAGPIVEVVNDQALPKLPVIELRADRIRRVLGFDMDANQVERILDGLGFIVEAGGGGYWRCTAPSWRFDISQEVDLIEELARIYGYNNLPISHIRGSLEMAPVREDRRSLNVLRCQLIARGFNEAITYSFIAPSQQAVFDPTTEPVALKNPISAELSVMRTSLIPGLANALSYNVKRQNTRVRLFEVGACFLPGEPLLQQSMLALAITGERDHENWASVPENLDFFDIKGEVEQILAGTGAELNFRAMVRPGLHDGQTAEILCAGEVIGVMGALHPETASEFDLSTATFVAELKLSAVICHCLPAYQDISRYPEIRRDLAVLVDRDISVAEVLAVVRATAGSWLDDLKVFDVYTGKGIDPERKSLALGLTFRNSSRTLGDSEISDIVSQVIDSMVENLGVELRG